MQWEILHVPGKPPLPLEQSTVDVIASTIEPRLANNLVRQLNQVYPLENLRHVKRVRRRTIEGKVELSVILCLSQDHVNHAEDLPNDVVQLINIYQLSTFNAKVAKYAATSREEWEEQCKLWPTSYHPPNNNLDGIGGFSEEDSRFIFNYMKDAIRLTRLNRLGDKVLNAALIVDPLSKQIIASGSDQTCAGSTSASKASLSCIPCSDQTKTVASLQSDANGLENNDKYSLLKSSSGFAIDDENSPPESLPDERGLCCASVACLHPWAWTEYNPFMQNSGKCRSNYSWHPLRHAALVAIENAAARDRQLFPGFGSSEGQSCQEDDLQHPSNGIPAKRLKILISDNERSLGNEVCTDSLPSESMRPYLCTGFDIYLVWEPCTMCAMALVHQRIRRIFYAFPNPNAGALGSVYRLQGEKSLNHHYSVFRIMLPENILYDARLNCSDESLLKDE